MITEKQVTLADGTPQNFNPEVIEDILDRSDFDPVKFINQKFPNEQSLDFVDTFLVGIGSQISALDDEISKAVQAQSKAGEQATRDIADAQVSIKELFEKIHDIKMKASQSERMVQEICADIKKLDYAKTHLQSTITSLKRLQMLITAVGQLELMASGYHYREVANLYDAVKQLLTHFERYTAIPKIAEIKGRVDAIQADLKKHVHSSFRELGQLVDTVGDTHDPSSPTEDSNANKALADACMVVDALGPAARRDLLEEFVQLQMLPYEKHFAPGKQFFSLEQVEQRWNWIKRLVRVVDSRFSQVFPPSWRLSHRLCLQFITRTRMHLVALLSQSSSTSADQYGTGGADVNALLKALQTALRFEQEMKSRFSEQDYKINPDEKPDELTAEGIKKKYKNEKEKSSDTFVNSNNNLNNQSAVPKLPFEVRLKRREEATLFAPSDAAKGAAAIVKGQEAEEEAVLARLATLEGDLSISAVFDDFLGPYVLLERRNLDDMLLRLGQEEDKEGAREGGVASDSKVYGSSMNMFVFIKNSIKRCTTLTTGNTFLALSKEFRNCLIKYADSLRARCPQPVNSGGSQSYRVAPPQELSLCYIINTGEYCAEVVPQLEAMVRAKINPNLADRVDFSKEEAAFTDVVAHALKVLASGVMDRLEQAFKAMNSVNWGTLTAVGEESAHIHQWHGVLQDTLPRIRDNALSPSYFKTFCTKFVSDFLDRYLDVIMKQKKISEMGTQQLLLDTYNVKTFLLQLPHLNMPADAPTVSKAAIPPTFMKLVTNRVAHIEMILKLVATPEELLLERFQMLYPTGGPTELQAIMSLKAMRKTEQTQFLESLGLALAAAKQNQSANGGKGLSRATVSPTGMNAKQRLQGTAGNSQQAAVGSSTLGAVPINMNVDRASIEEAMNSMASTMASSVRSLTLDMKSSLSTADSAVSGLGSVLSRTTGRRS